MKLYEERDTEIDKGENIKLVSFFSYEIRNKAFKTGFTKNDFINEFKIHYYATRKHNVRVFLNGLFGGSFTSL